MKKSTAGIALAAAVGFSAFAATPATAAVTLPFVNCDAAAVHGVYNIPAGTPGYGPHLDADNDGFGCDAAGTPAYDANIVARIVAENTAPAPVPDETQQVEEMPVGAADTGVSPESTSNTGLFALGGTAVLVAAAGGTLMIRRRSANRA